MTNRGITAIRPHKSNPIMAHGHARGGSRPCDMIEGTLERMRKCPEQRNLNIDAKNVAPA